MQGSARHGENLTATTTHAGSTLGALREMTDCLDHQGEDCRDGESQIYLILSTTIVAQSQHTHTSRLT